MDTFNSFYSFSSHTLTHLDSCLKENVSEMTNFSLSMLFIEMICI